MIYDTPAYPAFTDWVVQNRLLREPFRLLDIGVQGGIHARWHWFGDYLEVIGFDALADVIAELNEANPAPERIRYLHMGLGNEDGERLFQRVANPYGSAFLPPALAVSQIARDEHGKIPDDWSTVPIRKLDTLSAEGVIGTVNALKMDCEGFEIEIVKGAQKFIDANELFAIESETNLYLHPWYDTAHFVELYRMLGARGFEVFDLYFYRIPRAEMAEGFPLPQGGHRPIGQPDTFDFLFLRGFSHTAEFTQSIDTLLKMMMLAELYALQDVALHILTLARPRLVERIDVEHAAKLLHIDHR